MVCLYAAAVLGVFPIRTYASQADVQAQSAGGYSTESPADALDDEELEKELMELLKNSGQGESALSETLREKLGMSGDDPDELSQMQKVMNPVLDTQWDEKNGMMVYVLPNQCSFSASVPDGMITTSPVTLLPMENVSMTIWQDGMKVKPVEDGVYREEGNYQVKLLVLPNGNESGDNNLYEVVFHFRILPPYSSGINLVKAPDGFKIGMLEREGKRIEPEHPRWHFLGQDGRYRVRFVDQDTGDITFETTFIRDTTAPFLTFDPMPDRYEMAETVHVDIDDSQAGIEMFYNGKPVPNALNVLEIGGYYQYRVTDRTGNQRYYAVRMAERVMAPGPGVIITAFIVAGATAAWFIHQRRHPRFL